MIVTESTNRQKEVLSMKTTISPKTPVGKRSVYLFVIFIALSITGSVILNVQSNTNEYPNPINSPLLGTTIYLTFIIAIIAFITGLTAFFKHKERAIIDIYSYSNWRLFFYRRIDAVYCWYFSKYLNLNSKWSWLCIAVKVVN